MPNKIITSIIVGFWIIFGHTALAEPKPVLCDSYGDLMAAFQRGDLQEVEASLAEDTSHLASHTKKVVRSERYAQFIGKYIEVRMAHIGACGDRTTTINTTVTTTTTTTNFLGTRRDSSSRNSEGPSYTVPVSFAKVMRLRFNSVLGLPRRPGDAIVRMSKFVNKHGCDSKIRKRTEEAMLKFVQRDCAGCVNGQPPKLKNKCVYASSKIYQEYLNKTRRNKLKRLFK